MNLLFRLLLSVFTGLLLSVVWYYEWATFSIFFSFVPLLLVEEYYLDTRKNHFGIFNLSYISFFLWNLFTTYWIYKATLPGAIMAVLANSALMAFIFWLYHLSRRISGKKVGRYALVFWWVAYEYLFFNTEISWPWLTLGNAFANSTKIIQWFEYTGVLGGSIWVLLINILIVSCLNEFVMQRSLVKRRLISTLILLFTLIVIPTIYSYVRYANFHDHGEPVEIVIVQPNIDPYHEKFGSMDKLDQTARLIQVADEKITNNTRFVVGPETAVVERIWEDHARSYASIRMIEQFLNENPNMAFIVGVPTRREFSPGSEIPYTAKKFKNSDSYYDRYNSAIQITPFTIDFYHKSKLVPGVEKVPYYKYFKFLDNLAADLGGTVGSLGSQKESSVFSFKESVIAPIICYESVYPEYVSSYVKKGAGLLFIITNDGWWGNTSGYKQHMRYAKLRAIENRRSIARSANTGISAFINQRGDIIKATEWWTPTAIRHTLYENFETTYYAENGNYLGRVAVFFTILIILTTMVTGILKTKNT